MEMHVATPRVPKKLGGLIGRTTAAIAYPVTARTELLTLLYEGFATDTDTPRARLIVYTSDLGRICVQLIIKPNVGRPPGNRWATVENISSVVTLLDAWWPELSI